MKVTKKSSFAIIFGVLIFVNFALNAQAQNDGYYEMRCRGGEDLFRIDLLETDSKDNEELFGLSFSPSAKAAGEDGKGLQPGTCSWIDRTLTDGEPQQIQFRMKQSEIGEISAYLQKESNFWSFWVSNTNRGYYAMKSHKMWKPISEK